jgi:flotillin
MQNLLNLGLIPLVVGSLFIVILFFLMVAGVFRWIRKVPPNIALLVFGFRTKSSVMVLRRVPVAETEGVKEGAIKEYTTRTEEVEVNYRIVKGGWTLVLPVLHQVRELDLGVMTLDVKVENVLSSHAVPLTVDGIAQIKIGSDDTFIATAAEQLLDKGEDEIRFVASETLKGHLRAIIGVMTVEQVYKDREEFSQRVQEVAIDDLAGLGFEIKSFVIKDIDDPKGYLEALGRPEIAAKLRDARVAEATADREATEKEQTAEKAKAEAIKNTDVARAQFDAQVARERAVAQRAEEIGLAEQDKTLETRKAEAAEQAALRRDQELEAEVRRPADATLYAAQQDADGVRARGFASADVKQKTGEAEAEADKAKGLASADVTKAQRLAEATGTKAQLLAEAEGREQLAQSLNAYEEGALRYVLGLALLESIPEMADSFGTAFANIEQIRLIELGGDGGGEGAVDRFLDTIPNSLFKFLQKATALMSGPIDDLVVAKIAQEAAKHGLDISPEERQELKNKLKANDSEADEEGSGASPEGD